MIGRDIGPKIRCRPSTRLCVKSSAGCRPFPWPPHLEDEFRPDHLEALLRDETDEVTGAFDRMTPVSYPS